MLTALARGDRGQLSRARRAAARIDDRRAAAQREVAAAARLQRQGRAHDGQPAPCRQRSEQRQAAGDGPGLATAFCASEHLTRPEMTMSGPATAAVSAGHPVRLLPTTLLRCTWPPGTQD